MKKTLRKSFRKRIVILLLAVFLIPLVPIVPVSATGGSPFPFDYPSTDTFYPVDFVIKLFNVDGASYFRVRTDTGLKISYWKMGDPVYTIPVTPDPFSKYTFYDSNGNVVDNPFVGTRDENLLLFRNSDEDTVGLPYGIVQASNANLYSYDEGIPLTESDTYIYFYANYVSLATTPTPTPEPEIPLPDEMPDIDDLYLMCKAVCNYGGNLFDSHINPRDYVFVYALQDISAQLYTSDDDNTWGGIYGVGAVATYSNTLYFYKYDYDTEELTYLGNVGSAYGYNDGSRVYSAGLSFIEYGWNGKTVLNTCNKDWNKLGTTRHFAQKPYFFVYWSNGDIVSGENPNDSQPTPMPTPTFIPQPTSYPTPTVDPPDSGEDNNWTGLFGWLKRIRDSILNIPKKIASGLLDALKYIFIPDINRVKNLYADLDNKVGIVHPPKFEFTVNDLRRPNNVYYDFQPISVNGETAEPTRVTIIDFEKIDEWLDSDESEMFRSIIKAVFSLLVWGYMIYVFTKHIGSINYTDAQRLEGVYKRSNEVGGDETDV